MDSNALKEEFLIESFENLSSINEDLTHLEQEPKNKDLLNKIYRGVHTMKGSSSFLGYKKLQDITHSAENLLDELREEKFEVNSEIVDTLLETFDICNSVLKNIENKNEEGDIDIAKNKSSLDMLLENKGQLKGASQEGTPIETQEQELSEDSGVSSAAMDSLKELISEGKINQDALEDFEDSSREEMANAEEEEAAVHEESKEELVLEVEEPENEPAKETLPTNHENEESSIPEPVIASKDKVVASDDNVKNSIADSVVRVNVKVLDKIMNIVGELVLNRNQILQYAALKSDNEFSNLSQQLNIITSELQSEVMSTRMQPIGSVLTKFERLIRDFSRQSGKKITLKLSGQGTELDKTLIEAIKDPLVHIIRNSCDHGIEGAHERELKGKSETGTISIRAFNESGQVIIEISDDGGGLSREKISQKAIEKNIVTAEKVAKLTDTQIFSMIFEPGFSTAEKVTSISGRGVGMDVVRTNIEKIGGSVSISSVPGEGTTFKLRIPLTLAIVPALMVKSCGESFAIPQLNLVELVRLESSEDKSLIEKIQGSEFLRLRGRLTPIFRLDEKLNLTQVNEKNKLLNSREEEVDDTKNEFVDDAANIVILNAEDQYFGIIVDEILDTEEIVVKPLNKQLKKINMFGGAIIMGDGQVALILDAIGFLNSVLSSKQIKDNSLLNEASDNNEIIDSDVQENLLFKLADERVYAVPLSLVSRLEEFDVKNIELTGNQPIIRYLNKPMPLINIEKTLKLSGKSKLDNLNENQNEAISCIVTTIAGMDYGIVVEEIRDISIDQSTIDSTAVDREGILGTIFIKDSTVSLIDLYSIINNQNLGNKFIKKQKLEMSSKEKINILVVDDSPVYRKMEMDILQAEGYNVDTAGHGNDGLDKLKANNYDLIITDIEMPILDGYGFASKVRNELENKLIPIIAVSTRCSDADREKGKEAGFNHHLEKFNKDEILNLIKNILKEG